MEIENLFKGRFLTPPANIRSKLEKIKAYIFDWDGVFNNGQKDERNTSLFNEIDAMGINMLRFNHYQRKGKMPLLGIITGERNSASHTLADREHMDFVYYKIKHKSTALEHLCIKHNITPEEVLFVFDDILDLDVAAKVGLRMMVSRPANPLVIKYAEERQLMDYLTANDGNSHALREVMELLIGLTGRYDETLNDRIAYNDTYRKFITLRNTLPTDYYTVDGDAIIEKKP
ncbi:MAG TPA: phosphatase [Bacteroidia bacterium]|jgi:3-deoxy-D-manno-octulosonate 8-phosphate phosphatase (KDO 8-P phosphatase)|nr:phosphatase [Bacteroidia bacterium]